MRQNIGIVLIASTALLLSCASFSSRPQVPDDVGWLYDSVTFEIAPITSAEPSPRALEIFRDRLHANHICRRTGITFNVRQTAPGLPPGMPWNLGVLHSYETLRRSNLDTDPYDRDLKVFVAYIDGIWMEGGVLKFLGGIQYSNTAFAIFKSGAADREAAVLLHEFGHLIGLVKNESALNHDETHRHHCVVRRCVMYFTAPDNESDFDLYCRQEIVNLIRTRDSRREIGSRPAIECRHR